MYRAFKNLVRRREPSMDNHLSYPGDPAKVLVVGELNQDCKVCDKTSANHSRLCHDCQPWNDARHVFQCMQPIDSIHHYINIAPRLIPYAEIASRSSCLICSIIAKNIREFADARGLDQRKLRVLNGGPYFLPCFKGHRSDKPYGMLSDHEKDWNPISIDRVCKLEHSEASELIFWQVDCILYLLVDEEFTLESVRSQTQQPQPWLSSAIAPRMRLYYEEWLNKLHDVREYEEPLIRFDQMKGWIEQCRQNHDSCRETINTLPWDAKVIDVNNMKIVSLRDQTYVALSYTWSSSDDSLELRSDNLEALQKADALAHADLPSVLRDAMHFCADLGYRYLWIDRLCILQDNDAAKLGQIEAMDRIYSNASLTIVVATESGGRTGIPGVSGNPRHKSAFNTQHYLGDEMRMIRNNFRRTISSSLWNSRGWTFQERLLSHRLLYITDDDTYFECSDSLYQESLGYVLDSREYRAYINRYDMTSVRSIHSPAEYADCIREYSARQLSHAADILKALTGVCNVLVGQLDSKFDYGLPRRYLATSLFWNPSTTMQRRLECEDIPSWSWAAWLGATSYEVLGTFRIMEWGTLVRFYQKDEQNQLQRLEVEETWFYAGRDFKDIRNTNELPKVVSGKARPPIWTHSMWQECPQNPWTTFSHSTLSSTDVNIGSFPSKALVFRTMSANLRLSLTESTTRPNDRHESHDPHIWINQVDGTHVGHLMDMKSTWIDQWLDMNKDHEFIVLCAGLSSLRHPLYYKLGPKLPAESIWELKVMLVERDAADRRLCRRIAIGEIRAMHWKNCNPSWKLIGLV